MRTRHFTMTALAVLLLAATHLIGCSSGSSSPTEPLALDVTADSNTSALSATTQTAMGIAIEDEYKARAFYDAVLDEFGPIRPFLPIRDAETKHIEALAGLYDTYSLDTPSDPYHDQFEAPDSVQKACQMAVDAEIANAGIYDEILPGITEVDVIRVFERLRAASLDNHLPAFQACS